MRERKRISNAISIVSFLLLLHQLVSENHLFVVAFLKITTDSALNSNGNIKLLRLASGEKMRWFNVEDHCCRWWTFMCMPFVKYKVFVSRWKRYSPNGLRERVNYWEHNRLHAFVLMRRPLRARQKGAIVLHILSVANEIVCYKNYVHVFDGVCKILLISLIENTATD